MSGHPFLHWSPDDPIIAASSGVNPLYVGTPISTSENNKKWLRKSCVNPLSIGTPISTARLFSITFLFVEMCQSPIYRDTHFYITKMTIRFTETEKDRVNPLSIGTPISTPMFPKWEVARFGQLCQSPIYRDTHFYENHVDLIKQRNLLCQSPIYRDTHFYAANRSEA